MTDPNRTPGRGARSNPANRYHAERREAIDDGWPADAEPAPPLRTELGIDASRTVISRNQRCAPGKCEARGA